MSFPKFLDDVRQAVTQMFPAGLSLCVELPAKDVMHKFAALPIQFAGMTDASEESHV